eukprot:2810967-Rhodomonas_salina.1
MATDLQQHCQHPGRQRSHKRHQKKKEERASRPWRFGRWHRVSVLPCPGSTHPTSASPIAHLPVERRRAWPMAAYAVQVFRIHHRRLAGKWRTRSEHRESHTARKLMTRHDQSVPDMAWQGADR